MTYRQEAAHIYIRRNGEFGSSCDGTRDTGHVIISDGETFTVYPVGGGEEPLVRLATKRAAEIIIARDWRVSE